MIRNRIILLVEDNPDDVELALRAFEINEIANKIVVANDGQEALDYLFAEGIHAGRPPAAMPDVVLLDLKLPRLDGHEVLRRIRMDARTNRLPVVVLSSSNEERDISASYDLGANSFVRKPLDLGEFIKAVRELGSYWLLTNQVPWKWGRAQRVP
ncbi:MAG TPA: response regulator [Bryobacteraceae bacterium]|nr:response regulator [Bryobacteraceae bacterium]